MSNPCIFVGPNSDRTWGVLVVSGDGGYMAAEGVTHAEAVVEVLRLTAVEAHFRNAKIEFESRPSAGDSASCDQHDGGRS
jgi:hypothetical protein